MDNVYSHRSTQRCKRKPFVSRYWDCRLKGRPSGTPKSDDPLKKKRKRVARGRDLCDVKIKITEYFPTGAPPADLTALNANAQLDATDATNYFAPGQPGGPPLPQLAAPFPVLTSRGSFPPGHPGADGKRFYTIQRVNGNGGNGKGDGIAGPHKHTLADSDRIKKNSIHRSLVKQERERKKVSVRQSVRPFKRLGSQPSE